MGLLEVGIIAVTVMVSSFLGFRAMAGARAAKLGLKRERLAHR